MMTQLADAVDAWAREDALVARLRAGDQRAFESLVATHHGAMLAVAFSYVRRRDVAEEVVQETWVGVLRAIGRFESRASLKTWIFRILVNTAMTRGGREARSIPFSSLEPEHEPAASVDPERFHPPGDVFAGHWRAAPRDWGWRPEDVLGSRETLAVVKRAIAELPALQRRVITMRDVVGFTADEVCDALELSGGHQRVLLHRARSRVRGALEAHFDD
jgi:RNA polymerase sigma-70 factor (ECF subfamily)